MVLEIKKKKIIHFIPSLGIGGAETLVKNYLLYFDKNQFDAMILCIKHTKGSFYEKVLEENGIKIFYLEDHLIFKNNNNFFVKIINYFYRRMTIRTLIRDDSLDVLHIHFSVNDFMRKFARPKHTTVLIRTIHNEPKTIFDGSRKKRKEFVAAKWFVKHYGMRFIVLHDAMQKEINEMFEVSNSIILNNGIDINRYRNVRDKLLVRKELEIPEHVFVVGHIGRFFKQKNHDFLVEIFKKISDKRRDTLLLMVGDGPEKERIKRKLDFYGLNNHYKVLSNRSDVPDLLNIMDVFVFPSLYEGLPVVLIEAQESRKMCYISDSIKDDAVISNLVKKIPLDLSPEEWARAILDYNKPKKIILNDGDWNIRKITKKLEKFYLDTIIEKRDGKK